jgi:hypothetical protein
MSWEEMSCETCPCHCGKGTITYRSEMDDWNRVRSSETINCTVCQAKADAEAAAAEAREREREKLLAKAHRLGRERYQQPWLALFENKTKKEAWMIHTGGRGYPALGTFYNHVRGDGVEKYLRQHFEYDLERVLRVLRANDAEIKDLLERAEKLRVRLYD